MTREGREASMSSRTVLLAGSLLLAAGTLAAQALPAERIPIRDPEQLAALGMPRDAKNVYAWSRADRGRGGLAKDSAAVQDPETWGAATGFTTVMGYQLQGVFFFQEFSTNQLIREVDRTYCQENTGNYMRQEGMAQLSIPDGANLEQFQFWAYDEEADYDLTFNVFETCQVVGYDPPATTLIASTDTVGSAGYTFGSKSLNGYKVNNRDCGYSVHVVFSPYLPCHSDRLQVQKLQVSWVREVTPAPPTATFNDVPSSNPFFQFIEALAKSGITGGCGGGNFCPDQALTRGQMAVFLAKGLGLSWP